MTHAFAEASFSGPTWCAYCGGFLWGIVRQGLRCAECGCAVHRRCVAAALSETHCAAAAAAVTPPSAALPAPEPLPAPVAAAEQQQQQQQQQQQLARITTSDGPAIFHARPLPVARRRSETPTTGAFACQLPRRKGVLPPLPKAPPQAAAAAHVQTEAEAREAKRQKAVQELVDTERAYVEDLSTIVSVHLATVRLESLLPQADVAAVFGNVEAILTLHHELLSGMLLPGAQVGGCMLQMGDYFKHYIVYARNGDAQVRIVNEAVRRSPAFAQFIREAARRPECRQLDMLGFLIKPIQRLCKYPLLLREILRYSEDTQQDTESLRRALAKISEVVATVNKGKRENDGKARTVELQSLLVDKDFTPLVVIAPHRRFLRDAVLVEINSEHGEAAHMHYILFNDTLIRARQSWLSNKLVLETSTALDLVDVSVPDERQTGPARAAGVDQRMWCFSLFLYGSGSGSASLAFIVCCESAREREEWLLDIRTTKEALLPHDGLVMLNGVAEEDFELIPGAEHPPQAPSSQL